MSVLSITAAQFKRAAHSESGSHYWEHTVDVLNYRCMQ
jgi:hypothetical protein